MEEQVRLSELAGRRVLLGSGLVLLERGPSSTSRCRPSAPTWTRPMNGLQRTVNAFTLTLAALPLLGGGLDDRFGRRRVYLLGIVWFGSRRCCVVPRRAWVG